MGEGIIKVTDFTVELVNHNAIRGFVRKNHYSGSTRGLHISYCLALYSPDVPF